MKPHRGSRGSGKRSGNGRLPNRGRDAAPRRWAMALDKAGWERLDRPHPRLPGRRGPGTWPSSLWSVVDSLAPRLPGRYDLETRPRVNRVLVAAVGVHHVDGSLGEVVVDDPHVGDLVSLRRPGGAELDIGAGGQPRLPAAVGVHDVDVAGAGKRVGVGDLGAVRAPVGQLALGGRIRGQLLRGAAVRVHHPDLVEAGAVADEGDLRAVRRPDAKAVVAGAARQPDEPRAVEVNGVEVAARIAADGAGEEDLRPVGREVGEQDQAAEVGDLLLLRPVLLHRPDLDAAAAVAVEGYILPARRVARGGVERGIVGQAL